MKNRSRPKSANYLAFILALLPCRSAFREGRLAALTCFLVALSEKLLVLSGCRSRSSNGSNLSGIPLTLALDALRSDKALDLWRLRTRLGSFLGALLNGNLTADNVLTHVVVLGQVEKLTNVGRTLRSQPTRDGSIGEPLNWRVTILNDEQVEDGNLMRNNAASNALALALTAAHAVASAARSVLGHEETDAVRGKHSLLHGEALLVLATHDAENVASVLLTEIITVDLHGEAHIVKVLKPLLIFDFNLLLRTRLRVCKIEL